MYWNPRLGRGVQRRVWMSEMKRSGRKVGRRDRDYEVEREAIQRRGRLWPGPAEQLWGQRHGLLRPG